MVEPTPLLGRSRRALLDAVEALHGQREALIVVGAQAIYLHTGVEDEAIATETRDSDIVVNPAVLEREPLLQEAMEAAGFHLDLSDPQPGGWIGSDGVSVDLMIPDAVSGTGRSRRSPSIPPHDKMATRKARGLEAALVDRAPMTITALQGSDDRTFEVLVAGPSALVVAKLHKIAERLEQPAKRQRPKDSHDVFRLMRDVPIERFAEGFAALLRAPVSAGVTAEAVAGLDRLFARPGGAGAQQAGATIAAIGDAEALALRCSVLAAEVVAVSRRAP